MKLLVYFSSVPTTVYGNIVLIKTGDGDSYNMYSANSAHFKDVLWNLFSNYELIFIYATGLISMIDRFNSLLCCDTLYNWWKSNL